MTTIKIGNGHYWHHGLELCLKKCLSNRAAPDTISLNINIDGLPIYKSSKCELWPILCNIYEIPEIKPIVIGIYCGYGKPSDIVAYFQPFVDEMKNILSGNITIHDSNQEERKIQVKIRCFICDSPARAFIKGKTLYFNNY